MHNKNNLNKIFIVVVSGFFVVMLDSTVVNVALVAIGKSIHASDIGLQWVVNGYTLSLAATLLAWGSMCDRFGAHYIYAAGLTIFAFASMACGLANETAQLLAARAVQGFGGACLIPASLALVSSLATTPQQRAQFIGWWGASGGLAAAAGPLLGGLLTSQFGWRAIFFLNLPIIGVLLVCLTASLHTLKQVIEQNAKKFDWVGSVLMTFVMVACCYVVIQSSTQLTFLVGLTIGVCIAAFAMFVIHERRSMHPLLPLKLVKDTHFISSNMVGFCLNFSFFGELFVFSLYLQNQLGLDSAQAGFALFPQTCSAIIAAPLGGKYAAKRGNLRAMQAGLGMGCVGFMLLNFIDQTALFALVAAIGFLASFGMAFAMPAATNQAVSCASGSEQGTASGVINTARQFGTVMGVAVIGVLFAVFGIHAALICAAAMYLLPLMLISVKKEQHT